ncbi:MAG TPA: hypothetical protein EYQ31_12675 [Candidatus Handelsmanbacteria bacterium]|nr:hypothetical protein [Candidatus Handelsmanbacteria bacterium]
MSHSNDQSFGDDGHLNGIFDQLDVPEDVRRRLAQARMFPELNSVQTGFQFCPVLAGFCGLGKFASQTGELQFFFKTPLKD